MQSNELVSSRTTTTTIQRELIASKQLKEVNE